MSESMINSRMVKLLDLDIMYKWKFSKAERRWRVNWHLSILILYKTELYQVGYTHDRIKLN